MRLILLFLTFVFSFSCAQKETTTKPNTSTTSKKLFNEILNAHGVNKFESSKVSFQIDDTQFTHIIDDGRSKITQVRTKENKIHKAQYYGGSIQYYIDNELQDDTYYPRAMLERSLYGFVFTNTIPFSLRTNDVRLKSLNDVTIRKEEHYVLEVTFTEIESDNPDRFLLYINKKNNHISYIALKHKLTSNIPQFRRLTNPRVINGILFQDYIIFTPENTTLPLDQLQQYYENADLKVVRNIDLNNIQVSLN